MKCRDPIERGCTSDVERLTWEEFVEICRSFGREPLRRAFDMIPANEVCDDCVMLWDKLEARAGQYCKPEPPSIEERLTNAGIPRSTWYLQEADCENPSGCTICSEKRTTLIIGGVGVGKTVYCAIYGRFRIKNGRAVKWIDTDRWLKETSACEDREIIVGKVAQFDGLLILDEFVPKKVTEWKQETMFAIINTRTGQLLDTLINTSASVEEITNCWGVPVVSRLRQGSIVEWKGRDRR